MLPPPLLVIVNGCSVYPSRTKPLHKMLLRERAERAQHTESIIIEKTQEEHMQIIERERERARECRLEGGGAGGHNPPF